MNHHEPFIHPFRGYNNNNNNDDSQPNNIKNPTYIFDYLATITCLNCYSVNLATGTQNLFTGAKLVAIFIVVVGGIVRIAQGQIGFVYGAFDGTKTSFSDIATAFYSKSQKFISYK